MVLSFSSLVQRTGRSDSPVPRELGSRGMNCSMLHLSAVPFIKESCNDLFTLLFPHV